MNRREFGKRMAVAVGGAIAGGATGGCLQIGTMKLQPLSRVGMESLQSYSPPTDEKRGGPFKVRVVLNDITAGRSQFVATVTELPNLSPTHPGRSLIDVSVPTSAFTIVTEEPISYYEHSWDAGTIRLDAPYYSIAVTSVSVTKNNVEENGSPKTGRTRVVPTIDPLGMFRVA